MAPGWIGVSAVSSTSPEGWGECVALADGDGDLNLSDPLGHSDVLPGREENVLLEKVPELWLSHPWRAATATCAFHG